MTEVTVTVPAGVYGGHEFTVEYEGQTLSVVCPAGCRPGDDINLQIDVPPPAPTQPVVVVVPSGCYTGDEFTVDFQGTAVNVVVPHGVGPGQELTVDVPAELPPQSMVVTDAMFNEAFKKASRLGGKPDVDVLRWCLNLYCEHNGDIVSIFRAMGDNPREALNKPLYCDTPEKDRECEPNSGRARTTHPYRF